jgi:hypothetical protein
VANSHKKHKTKAERHHLSKVAALGCMACRVIGYDDTPAELHHIRSGVGMGQRNDNYHVIPLCSIHHRLGKSAIHQSKVNFESDFGTELELLEMVNNEL